MTYQPIENYGMIGDMHTVALVSIEGSIDWLCMPHFDSPSIFAKLLDDQKGGHFVFRPHEDGVTHRQFYWPETNVLVTRFLAPNGAAELTDFMPVDGAAGSVRRQVVRRLTVVRGNIDFQMECRPAFNYARDAHQTELVNGGAVFSSASFRVGLSASVPLAIDDGSVTSTFTLNEGETAVFVLRELSAEAPCDVCLTEGEAEAWFRATVDYWQGWLRQCRYTGRWREMVHRSALALKLLTFAPTGAIVAAPTCSLPEGIGGERNWDYRYTWIRDSAFTLYALLTAWLH